MTVKLIKLIDFLLKIYVYIFLNQYINQRVCNVMKKFLIFTENQTKYLQFFVLYV